MPGRWTLLKITLLISEVTMKKLILSILFILLFNPTTFAETISQEQNVGSKEQAQVLIENSILQSVALYGNGIGTGFCSGVILKNTDKGAVILTAKHCLGIVNESYADNSEIINAIPSFKYDLALVYTDKKIENKYPVVVAKSDILYRKIVYLVGYPIMEQFISVGYTLVRTHKNQFARLDIQHGCSGGGVFDENGELVGIATMGVFNNDKSETASLTIFEPIQNIMDFLNTIKYKLDN